MVGEGAARSGNNNQVVGGLSGPVLGKLSAGRGAGAEGINNSRLKSRGRGTVGAAGRGRGRSNNFFH